MKKIALIFGFSGLFLALAPSANAQEFVAEGESTHVPNTCSWAASEAFRQAWEACDGAGYARCDGTGPYQVIERRDGYCRAGVKIVGSN